MNEEEHERLGAFHAIVAGGALVVLAGVIVGGIILLATVVPLLIQLSCL